MPQGPWQAGTRAMWVDEDTVNGTCAIATPSGLLAGQSCQQPLRFACVSGCECALEAAAAAARPERHGP